MGAAGRVRWEPFLSEDGSERRVDLRVTLGPHVYDIDVSGTNPSCITARKAGSAEKAGVAAALTEKRKHASWDPLGPQGKAVIPFVIESGGRLGNEAIEWLDRLCSTSPHLALIVW